MVVCSGYYGADPRRSKGHLGDPPEPITMVDDNTVLSLWMLLALLVLLGGGSLVWSTVRSGMSPMPSSRPAVAAVLAAIDATGAEPDAGPIVDLGSGWGHLVFAVARHCPQRQVVGYEVSWLPWAVSRLVARLRGLDNIRIHRRDFLRAAERGELVRFHTALTYLHGPGMSRLQQAFETQPGNLHWLISNNFAMPDWTPYRRWRLRDFYRSPLYLYPVNTVIHQKGSD